MATALLGHISHADFESGSDQACRVRKKGLGFCEVAMSAERLLKQEVAWLSSMKEAVLPGKA